ncbi:hypothetical protein Q7P37_003340 [Cladosporium fusiforme]
MCIEHHQVLACGHHDDSHQTPVWLEKCDYTRMTEYDQRFSDRVNGPHRVFASDDAIHYDMEAICSDCRTQEERRARHGEPLKWPDAKDTI